MERRRGEKKRRRLRYPTQQCNSINNFADSGFAFWNVMVTKKDQTSMKEANNSGNDGND